MLSKQGHHVKSAGCRSARVTSASLVTVEPISSHLNLSHSIVIAVIAAGPHSLPPYSCKFEITRFRKCFKRN